MKEHKLRAHKRVVRLCKAAGFPDPTFFANLFTMMLEGAHSCGTCVGMRQIGEHLVQVVDLMVENNRRRTAWARPGLSASTYMSNEKRRDRNPDQF
ncbi:MAG: hypothetical protein ACXU9O_12590 [Gemmatimonadaceae bacterium]